ncbi:hypothetical protein [Priestia aryabhattai]
MTNKSKIQAFLIALVAFGIIIYVASGKSLNSDNEIKHQWYSTSPTNILNSDDAQKNIDNIKTLQDTGWRLLMQDGKPISFNEDGNARNEIIEKAASNLLHGCYELDMNDKGEMIEAKPSEEAKEIFIDQQNNTIEE